jgi:hypothetical protein
MRELSENGNIGLTSKAVLQTSTLSTSVDWPRFGLISGLL